MKLEERLKVLGEKWANLPAGKEANEIADECMGMIPAYISELQRSEFLREQAEKACAEMREAIKALQFLIVRHHAIQDSKNSDDFGFCSVCVDSEGKDLWSKHDHALSTACGSDYIHRDGVRPLVQALESLAGYSATIRTDRCEVVDDCVMCLQTEDWCNGLVEKIQHAEQALTHAEKLLKGETK